MRRAADELMNKLEELRELWIVHWRVAARRSPQRVALRQKKKIQQL
jgi:hypothetical protein